MKIAVQLAVFLVLWSVLLGLATDVVAAGEITPADTVSGGWNILGHHTVRPRETLFCIGRAYGVDPWAIATQNNLIQSHVIYSGMVLAIPDAMATLPFGPVCAPQFDVTVGTTAETITSLDETVDPPAAPQPAPEPPALQPPEPAAPPPASSSGCVCRATHHVVAGDNLTRISLHYGVNLRTIADCNRIANVNLIRIGEVLCIP